jgi:APA family basic amino acid/polyamine antiporter
MAKSPWRKKPISQFEADMKKNDLNRILGRWGLTSLGIGAIIGGGIFTLTGIAAHDHAGPALALAFVIAGIGCLFASLCYAEFSAVLPVEGSAYAYSYGTVGEIFAWIIGWNLILEYMMGATTVAVSWSGYFGKLLDLMHIHLPIWLMMDYSTAKATVSDALGVTQVQEYLSHVNPKLDLELIKNALAEKKAALSQLGLKNSKEVVKFVQSQLPSMAEIKMGLKNSKEAFALIKEAKEPIVLVDIANGSNMAELKKHYSDTKLSGWAINLPAFLITWVVTSILVKGIKEAAKTNNLIVILKVAVVLFVIIAGAFYINTANWSPFIPNEFVDYKGNSHFGMSGVLTAATIVFFAYIGFDAVSTQAGEAKNPKKDVPFAIIASLLICTVLYILVSLVLTGMVKYSELDMRAPVASAFSGVGLTWAVYIIVIAATAGLISVMLVMMLGQTRIFLGMAKDGLLPKKMFGFIHPKFKTPSRSTILVGGVISVVAAVTPINSVSEMCSMGTLLAFAMISIAVVVLRVKQPQLERPFKTPAIFIIGPAGALFNIGLMYFVRPETWIAFICWSSLGILVYFLYSRNHSNLNQLEFEQSLKGHDAILNASEEMEDEKES